MIRKSILATAMIIVMVTAVRAADFVAQPGMWRATVRIERDGQMMAPQTHDHCASAKEMHDDWSQLSQRPMRNSPDETCTRTKFQQTSSSIHWSVECTGKMKMAGDGAIVFDSPQHYSGTITMAGNMMGHPVNNVVHLEGRRIGACTAGEPDADKK
jgi:hypothetical protein